MIDYYETMCVSKSASFEEIKKAYRKLSLKFHPDKNNGDPYFEEWSKKINEAYEILGNPEKKKLYDKQINNINSNKNPTSAPQKPNSSGFTQTQFEKETLTFIQKKLPSYYRSRKLYEEAQSNFNKLNNRSTPRILTPSKIIVSIIIIFISLIGLNNSISTSSKDDANNQTQIIPSDTIPTDKVVINQPKKKQEVKQLNAINLIPENAEYISVTYIVISDNANIFISPNNNTKTKLIILTGEKIIAIKKYKHFVYTEYTSQDGKLIKGWLKTTDLALNEDESKNVKVEPVIEKPIIIDSSTTTINTNNPIEDEIPKKKKKGFFKRIFGRKNE